MFTADSWVARYIHDHYWQLLRGMEMPVFEHSPDEIPIPDYDRILGEAGDP